MIIQCDQCKTRFRLDDSRVTDTGVRVRCSRCKHTFVVKREGHEEQEDANEIMEELKRSSGDAQTQDDTDGDVLTEQTAVVQKEQETKPSQEASTVSRDGLFPENSANDPHANAGAFCQCAAVRSDSHTGLENEEPAAEKSVMQWAVNSEDEVQQVQNTDDFDISGKRLEEKKQTISCGTEEFLRDIGKNDCQGNNSEPATVREFAPENSCDVDHSKTDSDQPWDIFPTKADSGVQVDKDSETVGFVYVNTQNSEKDEQFRFQSDDSGINPHVVDAGVVDTATDLVEDFEQNAAKGKEQEVIEPYGLASTRTIESMSQQIGDAADTAEGDLPPLAITSRRKKSLSRSIALVGISLFVLLVGFAGLYFSKTDFTTFHVPGLSGSSSWFTFGQRQNGGISIKNLEGSFIRNNDGGEVFVVRGEAYNHSPKACTSFQIQGYIYGNNGEIIMKTPAHFGENFSNEQLMALPMNEIEAHFKTQSENFSQGPVVQPGKGIPFLIVFRNVPQGAGEFGADVLRSTVVSP